MNVGIIGFIFWIEGLYKLHLYFTIHILFTSRFKMCTLNCWAI